MNMNKVEMNDNEAAAYCGGGVSAYYDLDYHWVNRYDEKGVSWSYLAYNCPYCDKEFAEKDSDDALAELSLHCSTVHPVQDSWRSVKSFFSDIPESFNNWWYN